MFLVIGHYCNVLCFFAHIFVMVALLQDRIKDYMVDS